MATARRQDGSPGFTRGPAASVGSCPAARARQSPRFTRDKQTSYRGRNYFDPFAIALCFAALSLLAHVLGLSLAKPGREETGERGRKINTLCFFQLGKVRLKKTQRGIEYGQSVTASSSNFSPAPPPGLLSFPPPLQYFLY